MHKRPSVFARLRVVLGHSAAFLLHFVISHGNAQVSIRKKPTGIVYLCHLEGSCRLHHGVLVLAGRLHSSRIPYENHGKLLGLAGWICQTLGMSSLSF